MTIIIKDIPGMDPGEVLDVLNDITNSPVQTGHGGFVVPEETAYEFLRAFLTVSGYIQPEISTLEPEPEPEPEPTLVEIDMTPPKRRPGRPRKVQP